MERFPILDLILRYGTPASVVLGVIGAALVLLLAWTALAWIALPLALFAGGLVFVLGKSYVEIVTIVTEMLVPR
ncbi:MAG TPA: hypothetical protein VFC24_01265 [Casimicrobiaceae bacterium]|nr:hypothetical protein [Casimicrobiaceae bacterium]